MSKFQIISLLVFAAIALTAVFMFAGFSPDSKNEIEFANLEMWGTIPQSDFGQFISAINRKNNKSFKINYKEKTPENFENELLNALASGKGPDMWIIGQDMILKHKDKVFLIPYESFSKRDFKDKFIEEGELFFSEKGIVGIPLIVDPLSLFWNRDMFSSAGITKPPEFWDEFIADASLLTIMDNANNIVQSGAAMGEFHNVAHAKDIISTLILQTGNLIIDPSTRRVLFGERMKSGINPAERATGFYTEFSNPAKEAYSWNRSLSDSPIAFSNASLAMYFGYASELPDIQERNPHLNFDVASVPQIRDGAISAVFGKMRAVVISKSSKNINAAFNAVFKMQNEEALKEFSASYFLMPAQRAILSQGSENPALSVFYKSAVQARGWLEPDPEEVSKIFQDMVESTATGRLRVSEAVKIAKSRLKSLIKEI